MSVALVKGIIISLSVVAAIGVALQQPEVKAWIEDQRRRLAEMLRTLSENLDPQTRSQAEAFAYEGRMPTQREVQGMSDAAAVATGRDVAVEMSMRRTRAQNTATAEEMAERRRLGREYLARRNQEMLLRSSRGSSETIPKAEQEPSEVVKTPQDMEIHKSDTLAGEEGTLKIEDAPALPLQYMPPIPMHQSTTPNVPAPVAVRAFQSGSSFSNPFGDEFSMDEDRAATPRPVVPPKVALTHGDDDDSSDSAADPPISAPHQGDYGVDTPASREPSTYGTASAEFDEQLARALSLSLDDDEEHRRQTLHRRLTEEADYLRAIEESLKNGPVSGNGNVVASSSSLSSLSESGPLVDFSSLPSPPRHEPTSHGRTPSSAGVGVGAGEDELYTLTPMATGSADVVSRSPLSAAAAAAAAAAARSSSSSGLGSVEIHYHDDLDAARSMRSFATVSAEDAADEEEGEDEFESVRGSVTAHSIVSEDGSLIEVEDVDDDDDDDDDDVEGIHTPPSWSEVGSVVDDSSERSESETGDLVHV